MMGYLLVFCGFVQLIGGAEILIRGATAVADKCGVSTFLIGLTLVAFGTPESAIGTVAESNLVYSPAPRM